jgi:WD40 repeat protein
MLSTAWRMHISYLTIWVMRRLWASFILRSSSTKLHHGAFSQLFVNEKTSFMYIGSFKCSSVSPLREYNAETVNNRRKLNHSKLPPRLQLSNVSCFVFWFLSSFLFATFLWDKGPNNHLPIMVNLDNGHLKLDSPWFLFFWCPRFQRPILLKGHERSITVVKYNYDGDLLFTASKDHVPSVWRAEDGERLGTFNGHKGTIWDLDCDRFSNRLVTASADA